MNIHQIKYTIACRECKKIRPSGFTMLQSDNIIESMTREELISELDYFEDFQCNYCGEIGNWLVFNIQLDDQNEIEKQLKINIFKKDGEISGGAESGYFSLADLRISTMKIIDEIKMFDKDSFKVSDNGSGFILVDILNKTPRYRVTIFNLDGISLTEAFSFINNLRGQLPKFL